MGVTITGIAAKADEQRIIRSIISTNHRNRRPSEIIFDSELPFEALIMRKPGDDCIDIYSSEKGCVCTFSDTIQERYLWKHEISEGFDLFYFDVSETAMEHRFAFFSGGKEKYGMNVYDGGTTKRIHGDNFLNIQDSNDVFTGTLAGALEPYLPHSMGTMLEMGYQEKIRRYRFRLLEPEKTKPNGKKKREKRLLDALPLLILTGYMIHTVWSRFSQDILLTWHHWLALILLAFTHICFRKKNRLGVLATGLTILAGLFGAAQFSPGVRFTSFYWSPGDLDIPLFYGQPVFFIWLGLHLLLSGSYYEGILRRKYWKELMMELNGETVSAKDNVE